MFLGRIVVSHVQSIAKLSLNVSKSPISTFSHPFKVIFCLIGNAPAQPLAVSCVEEGKNTPELCSQQQMIGDE